MKASDNFKKAIETYLTQRAEQDALFAQSFAKPGKSIEECCKFILNTVKETGCVGFDDLEIYGIAVHYYDEDEIDPKYLKDISAKVVVNHTPQLTAEELEELAEKAKKDYYEECLRKQREMNKPKKKVKQEVEQPSLF